MPASAPGSCVWAQEGCAASRPIDPHRQQWLEGKTGHLHGMMWTKVWRVEWCNVGGAERCRVEAANIV